MTWSRTNNLSSVQTDDLLFYRISILRTNGCPLSERMTCSKTDYLFSALNTYLPYGLFTSERIIYYPYEWLQVRKTPRTNDYPNECVNLAFLPTPNWNRILSVIVKLLLIWNDMKNEPTPHQNKYPTCLYPPHHFFRSLRNLSSSWWFSLVMMEYHHVQVRTVWIFRQGTRKIANRWLLW